MSQVFEYKFVRVELRQHWNWLAVENRPTEDYHRIIQEHADQGWRLVEIFAPAIEGYGRAPFFELIFEREKE